MTALFLELRTSEARLDETIQNLDDDAALLLGNRRKRPAPNRRRDLLKLKAGIVVPLIVELKHPWTSSGTMPDGSLA